MRRKRLRQVRSFLRRSARRSRRSRASSARVLPTCRCRRIRLAAAPPATIAQARTGTHSTWVRFTAMPAPAMSRMAHKNIALKLATGFTRVSSTLPSGDGSALRGRAVYLVRERGSSSWMPVCPAQRRRWEKCGGKNRDIEVSRLHPLAAAFTAVSTRACRRLCSPLRVEVSLRVGVPPQGRRDTVVGVRESA